MTAITSVMRVQQLLLARVEDVLKPYGLTFAAFEALRLLAFTRHGSLPMGKMGERLMVHPAHRPDPRAGRRGHRHLASAPLHRG